MNAALRAVKATQAPAMPEPITGTPMQLTPIAWGKRDPDLARVVLSHIESVNASIVIPYNPIRNEKVRRILASHSIVHY